MKVSEFLRRYQIGGDLPDDEGDEMLNFWAGWLIGNGRRIELSTLDQSRDMAIKAAEFIESRVTNH